MKNRTILFQIACCMVLAWIPVACLSKSHQASTTRQATIRYGENGVPNLIKGDNLSAFLDTDSLFQKMKAAKKYADMALYYLDGQRELFSLTSARDEFIIRDVRSDDMGLVHIHLEQIFCNIPVWGKDMRIHLNAEGQVYYVHGTYQPMRAGLQTKATISVDAAGKYALRNKANPKQWDIERIAASVWAPNHAVQRLAYQVHLIKNKTYRESCFVDAADGRVLHTVFETSDAPNHLLPIKR